MACDTPIVATATADPHTYAATIAYAKSTGSGAALYVFVHRWSSRPPHMPVLALAPSHLRLESTECATCCTASLVDPKSPGRHAAINASRCGGASNEPLQVLNVTLSLKVGASAPVRFVLESIATCHRAAASSLQARVGVCLGPIFGSSVQVAQQRLLWQQWTSHTLRAGVARIFAYGLDEHAERFYGGHGGSRDASSGGGADALRSIVYSDWPRRWHAAVGLPPTGDASQSSRFSTSTYYVSQAMVLQR